LVYQTSRAIAKLGGETPESGERALPIVFRVLPAKERALPSGKRGLPSGERGLPNGKRGLPNGKRGLPRRGEVPHGGSGASEASEPLVELVQLRAEPEEGVVVDEGLLHQEIPPLAFLLPIAASMRTTKGWRM
jgi:hypothetical protein